ncbi:MAG: hypothetical protein WAV23_00030 [Minisyncoccia bacterium]
MSKTKTVNDSTNETSTIAVITSSVEKVVLFNFSIAVLIGRLNLDLLINKINTENKKMIRFGLDTVRLQAIVNYFKLTNKLSLSKEEIALSNYHYFMYCVANGINVLGWLDKIFPECFGNIFKNTSQSSEIIKQMEALKLLIDETLKDKSMHYKEIEIPFDAGMNAWANRFKQEHPNTAEFLDVKFITLAELSEFIEHFIRDYSLITKMNKIK